MFACGKHLGSIRGYHASELSESRVGIGFEKLDRAVFDPEKAYDKVAELGVKWVRIQSGWQRTETRPGEYDFRWLDDIADNLLRRGLVPWMCLCYGNRLYDERAAERFGGLGCPPIRSEEQRRAWRRYVTAAVRHFSDRITWWELWNEPDCEYSWNFDCNAAEYAAFARDTAAAVREGNPAAKIIGGSFAFAEIDYLDPLFRGGFADFCDAITYHVYSSDESYDLERIGNLRAMIRRYRPGLPLIQGEGGCQSRSDGAGALKGQMWTEEKQACSLSRHMVSQLGEDLMFTSYFSCMDMAEAHNGKVGESYHDFGYFGVLGADFDENGIATGNYTPKPSYRSLQVIASIFRETFTAEPLPVQSVPGSDPRYGGGYRNIDLVDCRSYGFRKPNGSAAFVYWKKGNLLSERYEGSISLKFVQVPREPVRLVDLIDGTIHAPAPEQLEVVSGTDGGGTLHLRNLPLFDRPVLIAFGDFL